MTVVTERDEIMERMGIQDISDVDARTLLNYFVNKFRQAHGFPYVVDQAKDLATVRAFLKRYGEHAGPIVKLLFDQYDGKFAGQRQNTAVLSRGSKWITDRLYFELMERESHAQDDEEIQTQIGTGREFLDMFGNE